MHTPRPDDALLLERLTEVQRAVLTSAARPRLACRYQSNAATSVLSPLVPYHRRDAVTYAPHA